MLVYQRVHVYATSKSFYVISVFFWYHLIVVYDFIEIRKKSSDTSTPIFPGHRPRMAPRVQASY